MDKQQIIKGFYQVFSDGEAPRAFFAPGRVNLIGEHIDYNGGYVFPCALSLGTYGAIRRRGDGVMRLRAADFEPEVVIRADELEYNARHKWANYIKGVARELRLMGHALGGFDLYVKGDLPGQAGLSSSASVELLACVAMNAVFGLGLDPLTQVKLCLRAENNYMGVNCGIMDQFASGMGKKGQAMLLNCGTLDYQYVPLELGDYRIVIANTNNKRGLADSQYNERRAQCEEALADLQTTGDWPHLCAMTVEEFERHAQVIKNPAAKNRAAHAVYENAHTLQAVTALTDGDLPAFGKLMNASHVSLRDLYEVTGPQLDALAEAAWACEGVIGSRMTGAGFGGCTVSIVRAEKVEGFIEKVGAEYMRRTGLVASFYLAETGDGARELRD